MKRNEILNRAMEAVSGREREYGSPEENLNTIARLWTVVLGTPVDADQVALCMTQVKIARLMTNPGHTDSWVDIAGYGAIGGEVAEAEVAAVQKMSTGVDETTRATPVPVTIPAAHDFETDDGVVDDPAPAKVKK